MRLTEVFKGCEYTLYHGDNKDVLSIVSHSKQQLNRSVFFASSGMVYNGNYYIPEAIKNGAVAVASEEYIDWHDDSVSYIKCGDIDDAMARCAKKPVCRLFAQNSPSAVTGTNGKTSFVSMSSQLYNFLGKKKRFYTAH
jgi:UDP-N-acetylmuramoyl-L-alanyl-D-glutamate--2,6-diaminopimelate ligase